MRAQEFILEKWSEKYKRSINCNNPKGFSQKAHCAGRKKNEDSAGVGIVTKQNATADVPVGGEYMNVSKLFPNKKRKSKKSVGENFADGTLNEYRNALYDFVKSKFPTWPEYVLKDFLYAQAKGIRDKEELKDWLERNQKDYGQVKWRLEKLPITLDIFTPKTQRMIQQREGGSSNPLKVPRDAERHELQAKIIQQKGVSPEPIIVAKLSNGYDLIEGWHRTIQHLKAYPEGYTGPAWVAYGATYTSDDVAENFADGKVKGKSRPGRVKKAGASCKGSVTDLRAKARKYGGEKGKMYHWCANMKGGKK